MYCPKCQSMLRDHSLLDPKLKGYICANGHVFYTTVVEQGVIPQAHTIQPPEIDDDIQVLKFWLTDARARERVPDQLALACRRIIEIVETDRRVEAVNEPFAFCPTCAEKLANIDSDDVYMSLLGCSNAHRFWWRGMIMHHDGDVGRTLSTELDDEHLLTLIAFYTSDDRMIRPYVHPQLRAVLNRFR